MIALLIRLRRLFSLDAWLAIGFLILLILLLGRCAWDARRDVGEARDSQAQADARTASAVEAISEIGRLHERGEATTKEVQDAQAEIRSARPDDRDRVARRHLCRLQQRSDCDGL